MNEEITNAVTDSSDVAHLASPLALLSATYPNFRPRDHQKVISDAVVDAVTGRGSRFLAVSVPPQFGKSTVTSIGTPLWYLELHSLGVVPGGLCGIVSYEDGLAMGWSSQIRRIISAKPDIFVTQLRKDSKAAGFWQTEQDGGVIAVGIAGSIVGRPISCLVIDDPTKNYEQAQSEKHREQVWQFWQTVGIGRLQPWTIVIITMTRWRDDDLIGRLLSPEFPGDPGKFRYIRIPAVAEEEDELKRPVGTPLLRPQSDQTVDEATIELQEVRASISTYHWNTLWQQSPVDPEGTIFSPAHWRFYGGDSGIDLPSDFDIVLMSWDMTFKETTGTDWVVGQAWGALGPDRYLLEQIRGHWGFTETCARVQSFAETIRYRYAKATIILVEDKANGPAVINALKEKINGLVDVTPEGSKESRAWACQPLQVGGNLFIPAPSAMSWVDGYIKELADFPTGAKDDQVDATTQALLYLQKFNFAPTSMQTGTGVDLSTSSLSGRRQ